MENVFNLPHGLPQFVKQEQSDPQETATLLEIGQTLADVPHLRRALARALELLCHARGFSRGFVLLLDSETDELRAEADEIVCAITPEPFYAVGLWYEHFAPPTDAEVRVLLDRAAQEQAAAAQRR